MCHCLQCISHRRIFHRLPKLWESGFDEGCEAPCNFGRTSSLRCDHRTSACKSFEHREIKSLGERRGDETCSSGVERREIFLRNAGKHDHSLLQSQRCCLFPTCDENKFFSFGERINQHLHILMLLCGTDVEEEYFWKLILYPHPLFLLL